MTTRSGPPDETELHAYADGQLPAERIAAVEGWLAEDAEARARLASWRAQNELIFRLYDSPVEPVDRRLAEPPAATAYPRLAPGRGCRSGGADRGHRRRLAGPRAPGAGARARWLSLPVRPSTSSRWPSRGDLPGQVGPPVPELAAQLSQALAHPV